MIRMNNQMIRMFNLLCHDDLFLGDNDNVNLTHTYYKVVEEDLCNRGYQYIIGLNELKEDFSPCSYCGEGGLYFCDLNDLEYWLHLHPSGLICEVTLPPNAQVVKQNHKYKADKIIINNPLPINEFITKHDMKFDIVAYDGEYLRYIDDQTFAICAAAIINNPSSFLHVKNQTQELCTLAIKHDYTLFLNINSEFVSPDIINFVLCKCCEVQHYEYNCSQNKINSEFVSPDIVNFVLYKCSQILTKIMQYDGLLLTHIEHQTLSMCHEAIKQNYKAFKSVHKIFQTSEMCHNVVKQDGLLLEYVEDKTLDLCITAMIQNKDALFFVPTELISETVKHFRSK